jgi:hypothetical protein
MDVMSRSDIAEERESQHTEFGAGHVWLKRSSSGVSLRRCRQTEATKVGVRHAHYCQYL